MPNSAHYIPAPGSAEYNKQFQQWDADERPQQYAAIIICSVAATVSVALRLYAQRRYGKGWGLDDLFIIVAWLIVLAELIASCQALESGAGLHQIRVQYEDQDPPHALSYIYTNYWIVAILWAPGVLFVKLSILVLYRRIFLVQQRWFKVALWANGAYALGLGIASTLLFIFQCHPIDYYWTRYVSFYGEPIPGGACLAHTVQYLGAPQILSTVSDLVILFLPVPIIWNLTIQTARKVALSAVFLLGAFTVGCGIARIAVIFRVTNETDVTWNNIDTVTFTVVEAAVGIVCACLPAAAPLYSAIMQKLGLMSPSSTGNHYYASNQRPRYDDPGMEFEDLIADQKFQAWSPRRTDDIESASSLQRPDNAITVENKIDVTSYAAENSYR
ncbi:hypothetical protein N7470_005435 [Penicillium chermesinum]|nr:hypothetical protein N7470_005435 [Penicillium chermesinum]